MAYDFLRFGPMEPKRGRTLEEQIEYFLNVAYKDEIATGRYEKEYVISHAKGLWEKHSPPPEVCGVYAFINSPYCIDLEIVPSRYLLDEVTDTMPGIYRVGLEKYAREYPHTDFSKYGATYISSMEVKALYIKMGRSLEEDRKLPYNGEIAWQQFPLDDSTWNLLDLIISDRVERERYNPYYNERYPKDTDCKVTFAYDKVRSVWGAPKEVFLEV